MIHFRRIGPFAVVPRVFVLHPKAPFRVDRFRAIPLFATKHHIIALLRRTYA